MTRTNAGPAKWSTACVVLLSAAALLGAAPASAEPIDDAFVGALAKNGIAMSDRNTAVTLGHTVCAGFDKGEASTAVAMGIVKETPLSPKQAGYFVGLSVAAYCPQYRGKTDNSMIWMVPFPPMM